MSQSLAKQTNTTARPSILSREASERISLTFGRIVRSGGRGEIEARNAPTQNERHALRGRLANLREAAAPASRSVIETLVGSLLAGFPAGRAHRDEPEAVLKMFVQALNGQPAWAISAACSAWNRGEANGKNTSFAPAPPDLLDLALSASRQFTREASMIDAILSAEVVPERESDERRAIVAAKMKTFAESLGEKPAPIVDPVEDFEAWEQRTKAAISKESGQGRYRLSAEALQSIGADDTNAPQQKAQHAA